MPKLNIVLDLDYTLICTHDDVDDRESNPDKEDPAKKYQKLKLFSTKNNIRDRVYSIELKNAEGPEGNNIVMYGVYRPYLKEFLKFLDEECDNIIVWTAGIRKYADEICNKLFQKSKKKPIIIYSKINRGIENESSLKPLRDLYKSKEAIERNINEKNTLIIDDNPDTFKKNKRNAIHIREFYCDINEKQIRETKDDDLLKIIKWLSLDKVKKCDDVRDLNKKDIFSYNVEEYDNMINNEN